MKKSVLFLLLNAIFVMANAQQSSMWYDPQPGDGTWRISKKCYGTSIFYDTIAKANHLAIKKGPNPNWIYHDVKLGVPLLIPNLSPEPQPEFRSPEPIPIPATVPVSLSWWENRTDSELFLGLAVFCLLILLIVLISKYIRSQNDGKQSREKWLTSASESLLLKEENERLRNKLPIEAPATVNADWLEKNNPVGTPIPLPSVEDNGQSTIQATERAFGKKPDLIAYAKVSTVENGTKIQFSNNRQAVTGLKDVNVFIGWDWNKEKSRWEEVGMLAGPCSNGFQANPEAVKKSQIFSKIELVNGQSPIIFTGDNVPAGVLYPKVIRPLVLQHHERNIADIRRTGSKVEIPEDLAPKTKNPGLN